MEEVQVKVRSGYNLIPSEFRTINVEPKMVDDKVTFADPTIFDTTDKIKYVIRYNFDLDGKTLELPDDAILEYDGGRLFNGTIKGENLKIIDLYGIGIGDYITIAGSYCIYTLSPFRCMGGNVTT